MLAMVQVRRLLSRGTIVVVRVDEHLESGNDRRDLYTLALSDRVLPRESFLVASNRIGGIRRISQSSIIYHLELTGLQPTRMASVEPFKVRATSSRRSSPELVTRTSYLRRLIGEHLILEGMAFKVMPG